MAIRTKHQNETVSTDSDVWQYGQNTGTRRLKYKFKRMAIRTKHRNQTVSTDLDTWQYGQNSRTRQLVFVETLMYGCATVRTDIELLFPCKWILFQILLHAEKYHTTDTRLLRRNDWKNLIATMCGGMEGKSKRENSLVRKVKVYHN